MIDYLLEKFPIATRLADGEPGQIRPLRKEDQNRLQKFYLAVPEEERLFIKRRVTDEGLFRDWCRHIDYEVNLPLLMLTENKIIGISTLHRRAGGWKRNIGLLTVLTHPNFRGRNVAKLLLQEMVELSRQLGLKRLETELNGEREIAIRALSELGFRQLVRLPDYLEDMTCTPHDYVLMGIDLITDEDYAGVG